MLIKFCSPLILIHFFLNCSRTVSAAAGTHSRVSENTLPLLSGSQTATHTRSHTHSPAASGTLWVAPLFLHPVRLLSEEHHSPLIFKQRRRLGSAVFYRRACFRMMTFRSFQWGITAGKFMQIPYFFDFSLLCSYAHNSKTTLMFTSHWIFLTQRAWLITHPIISVGREVGVRRGGGEVGCQREGMTRHGSGMTSKAVMTPLQFERHCS